MVYDWEIINNKLGRKIYNCFSQDWKTQNQVSKELGGNNPNRHVSKYKNIFLNLGYLDEDYKEREEKGRYRKLRCWKSNLKPIIDFFKSVLPYEEKVHYDPKDKRKSKIKKYNLKEEDIIFIEKYLGRYWYTGVDIENNPFEKAIKLFHRVVLVKRFFPIVEKASPEISKEIISYIKKYGKSKNRFDEKVISRIKNDFEKKNFSSSISWDLIYFSLIIPESLYNLFNQRFFFEEFSIGSEITTIELLLKMGLNL